MERFPVSVVYFGVREQLDGGGNDHIILEFDFKHFRLTKYNDTNKIYTANFAEIKAAQTDGTQVLVTYTISSIPT